MRCIAGRQKSINWQHWQQLELISPCLASRGCGLFNPPAWHAVPLPSHTLSLSPSLSLFPSLSFPLYLRANKKNVACGCCNPRRRHFTSQFSYNVDSASRFIATSKYTRSIIFICLFLVFLLLLVDIFAFLNCLSFMN